MGSSAINLSARYVFPVEGPPIARGVVALRNGRIDFVGTANERAPDLDLGEVAILPGFVNAHTHLELDRLEGNETTDAITWLGEVIAQRKTGSEGSLEATARRNAHESVAAGTTLVGDVTTAGASWAAVASAPTRGVVFAEMVGLKRMRGLHTSHEASEWIASIHSDVQVAANCRPGLSPHAPYSTAGWLYHKAVSSRQALATHLAEMPEELELLATKSGPLRTFLEGMGAWDDAWEPIGPRPADYIRREGLRNADWVVAHGTYLDPSEFWQFRPQAAPNGHRVSIVYCPRTHARFGHAAHPFRAMLDRGIVVCLGTDSLASTPSLSILDELRFVFRADESIPGRLLLTMATLFGAWALRADTITGSLKPGKSADLAVVALPNREETDPYRLLFDSNLPVVATVFEGRFTTGPWKVNSSA